MKLSDHVLWHACKTSNVPLIDPLQMRNIKMLEIKLECLMMGKVRDLYTLVRSI